MLSALAGCPSPKADPGAGASGAKTSTTPPGQPPYAARYLEIRRLLGQDPEASERSTKLYGEVAPICEDPAERKKVLDAAKWSASFSIGEDRLAIVLALDTLEHVIVSCFRTRPEAAFEMLAAAEVAVPDKSRYALIRARLLGAQGDLAGALASAEQAKAAGSVHAIALTANLQAQRAREQAVGYRAGMLDPAISTASAEPDSAWQLIDLTAVLSTRAHLLLERAVWEDEPAASQTLAAAAQVFTRLSVPPFIEATRTQAHDQLCFIAAHRADPNQAELCRRASEQSLHLGALVAGGGPRDAARFDLQRLERLEALAAEMHALKKGELVLLAFRGDEPELVVWARPAGRLLRALVAQGARVLLVDRTKNPRARALVDRVLDLGGVKPVERVQAEDTLVMPCVTALLAGRQTPKVCPMERAQQGRLEKLGKPALSFLVGRDLDAELDDLNLYALKSVLLSLRRPREEKGLRVALKSACDVLVLAPEAAAK